MFIAGWSSQVARWAHNPKVTGSNPVPATKFSGDVAQLAERLICIQEVAGSTPVISTIFPFGSLRFQNFRLRPELLYAAIG
jgi:hypothetical protein